MDWTRSLEIPSSPFDPGSLWVQVVREPHYDENVAYNAQTEREARENAGFEGGEESDGIVLVAEAPAVCQLRGEVCGDMIHIRADG